MMNEEYSYLRIGKATDVKNSFERKVYRGFEMLPGILAWASLVVLVVLAIKKPVWISLFIIVFDLYWFFKTIYLSVFLRATYRKMKKRMGMNWLGMVKELPHSKYSLPITSWEEIIHVIFLPMYKEDVGVLRSTFDALAKVEYPKEKMWVVLATEGRTGKYAQEVSDVIKKEYGDVFGNLFITTHPGDIAGELAGKGSNIAWAGNEVKKYIDKNNIPYEQVIVSAFDVDTQPLKGYFACLTHTYLTTKNPTRASYQPVPLFNNNIWQAPALARILSYSSTFWHMMQQDRADKETTFSSHSMSFKALSDVGFWQNNMVSEDSRIFFQCFFRYDGDYEVVSLYYPVSMDANVAPTFWRTLINQYKQQRRWAWGAENTAYFLFNAWKNKKMAFEKKFRFGFLLLEGGHSWATNSLIIFILGWMPILLGGEAFRTTVLSFNLPRLTGIVMSVSMVGILTSAILTMLLLPSPPQGKRSFHKVLVGLQWFLSPFVFIVFGSLPALDAQTRLMLGKYMGFWVTEKSRKK